jgi:hypothetical protein
MMLVWSAAVLALTAGMSRAEGIGRRRAPAEGQEKSYPLPEVSEPSSVRAWSGRLYISDSRSRDVLVYSLEGARFLGRLGRAGQGPGEFESAPKIVPTAGGLAAKSFSKLLFFSSQGDFLRETKGFGMDLMVSDMPVFPVEGGYIGFPFVRGADGRMNECVGRLYDEAWKPVRDFGDRFPSPTPPPPPPAGAKVELSKSDLEIIRHAADAACADGRIYLADSRQGLSVAVFDVRGEKVGQIRVPIPLRRVSREEKRLLLEGWSEARRAVAHLYNPVVPDVYPAFAAFRLDGGRMHVVTAEHQGGRYEILTLDLQGRILKRGFLFPLEPSWRYPPGTNGRFDILDGVLYTVDFNEEAERYELRVTPLR